MKPSSLIAVLDQALPGFSSYVESDENYYDRDSVHGVFAACSTFMRERPVATDEPVASPPALEYWSRWG